MRCKRIGHSLLLLLTWHIPESHRAFDCERSVPPLQKPPCSVGVQFLMVTDHTSIQLSQGNMYEAILVCSANPIINSGCDKKYSTCIPKMLSTGNRLCQELPTSFVSPFNTQQAIIFASFRKGTKYNGTQA